MTTMRIWVDLNKPGSMDRVILSARGTQEALLAAGIQLEEGLVLAMYSDDLDSEGDSALIVFDGVVHFDPDAQHWVAAIDRSSVRRADHLDDAPT